ncbi:MAG: hypothetical protein FWD03_04205 [Defluviitaleaceae bacterium]|nr:hypothetical protein [Defluviitaleaceae bacterium]
MSKYLKTAQMELRAQTNGGIIYLFPNIIVNLLYLVPLMFLWRVIVGDEGLDVGMTLTQLLTYTYVNALLTQMLVVSTFASAWNYNGQLLSLFGRPFAVFGQIIAQTVGGWVPMLIVFSLPMLALSPLFGIRIVPATIWFFPSLLLCIALGFAIDFIFSCLTIRLSNAVWLTYTIRMAIVALFSGTMIPFRILPFGLTTFFELQPFGSLGGAPLSLFVGTTDPARIIPVQIFWNLVLWPVAILWFAKSRERQVSYGG